MRRFMIRTPLEVIGDWRKLRNEKVHEKHTRRSRRGVEKTAE
jgi:hypothetical protein